MFLDVHGIKYEIKQYYTKQWKYRILKCMASKQSGQSAKENNINKFVSSKKLLNARNLI